MALQPSFSEIIAIPYIDTAAPTYTKALQNPLVVAAFPRFENRPGRHDIKRKLQPCMQAQIAQAMIRQIVLDAKAFDVIRIAIGEYQTKHIFVFNARIIYI